MKKILVAIAVMMLSVSSLSAASCVDLPKNVARYQESPSVLMLQNFLFEKGHLKAKPNGYFGAGTFNAVKAYQKSISLEQVGNVGPGTRAAIKKASCGAAGATPLATTVSSPLPPTATVVTPVAPVAQVIVSVTPTPTTATIRNEKRREDIIKILRALYLHYVDSRGVNALAVTEVPVELCVTPPRVISTATSVEVAVLVTPVSVCANYVDVSYLSPLYLPLIPRDPTLATSSTVLGYTITRSATNDILISAKNAEDNAIIKVTCNFNGYCKEIKNISSIIYGRPEMTSINRNIVLRDATPQTPLIIKGKNFTKKNTIKMFSLYNSKEYTIGDFSAVDPAATSSSISIVGSVLAKEFPCGTECTQKLPLGDYMLSVTNEGGESNTTRIALRGFTTSSISTQINGPVAVKTKNVKVATITLSSTIPVSLTSLSLVSTTTSKNLPSKISNFVLKDQLENKSYSGPTFALGSEKIFENQSKIYDVYVDVAEVFIPDAGFITYGGKFVVSDTFTSSIFELPLKEFSFTVSP